MFPCFLNVQEAEEVKTFCFVFNDISRTNSIFCDRFVRLVFVQLCIKTMDKSATQTTKNG